MEVLALEKYRSRTFSVRVIEEAFRQGVVDTEVSLLFKNHTVGEMLEMNMTDESTIELLSEIEWHMNHQK